MLQKCDLNAFINIEIKCRLKMLYNGILLFLVVLIQAEIFN